MNPIIHFEGSVEKAWKSEVGEKERARRLRTIAEAIEHYISRITAPAGTDGDSTLVARRVARATVYLKGLAKDSRELAEMCDRKLETAVKV